MRTATRAGKRQYSERADSCGKSSILFLVQTQGRPAELENFRPDLDLPDEPQHVTAKPGGRSVWFKWTAPAKGELALDTWNSGFDTLLAAYRQYDYPSFFGFRPHFLFRAGCLERRYRQHNSQSTVRFSVKRTSPISSL